MVKEHLQKAFELMTRKVDRDELSKSMMKKKETKKNVTEFAKAPLEKLQETTAAGVEKKLKDKAYNLIKEQK